MARTKKGSQKPTQSVTLSKKNSKGQEAVDLYNSTGRTAQKWQELLLTIILATNKKGLWVHTKYGYSVPRRNGKNEVVVMREMWGMMNGEKILHTAHRTTTSRSAWERLCSALDNAGIQYKAVQASGRESIRIKDRGRCDFRTRSSKGGLGEGFDLLVIDEAQEYQDDQESALKYVVTDSKNPQTVFCGTPPTPVSAGTVFMKFREATLQRRNKNAGWAEWSVETQSDPHDKALWYQTNPSLGTVFTERSVEDEIGTDVIDFNIQRLGLWIRYNQKSAISKEEWAELKCDELPKLTGKLFAGIKYARDGSGVALSIAAKTTDGRIFIETIDWRNMRVGNTWIIDFIRKADIEAVAADGAGNQDLLAAAMKKAGLKEPKLPTVKEIIAANAEFEQGLYSKKLCHMGQPSLEQVASNCEKRNIGSNGGFGYRAIIEGSKIEIMDSAIIAYWQCATKKEQKPQRVSY